jgi:hypothetical protein
MEQVGALSTDSQASQQQQGSISLSNREKPTA